MNHLEYGIFRWPTDKLDAPNTAHILMRRRTASAEEYLRAVLQGARTDMELGHEVYIAPLLPGVLRPAGALIEPGMLERALDDVWDAESYDNYATVPTTDTPDATLARMATHLMVRALGEGKLVLDAYEYLHAQRENLRRAEAPPRLQQPRRGAAGQPAAYGLFNSHQAAWADLIVPQGNMNALEHLEGALTLGLELKYGYIAALDPEATYAPAQERVTMRAAEDQFIRLRHDVEDRA